jgi:hypothetical protein
MMQCACRVSPFDVDLQIIQAMLQVKTPRKMTSSGFSEFFRFQTIGARLAYWLGY